MHTKNTKGLAERGHESKPSKRNRSCNEETPARRTVISAESLNRTDCLRAGVNQEGFYVASVTPFHLVMPLYKEGITAQLYLEKTIS